jgi:hypothetical protein
MLRRFFINAIHLHIRSLKAGVPLKQSINFLQEIRPLLSWRHQMLLAFGAPFLQSDRRFMIARTIGHTLQRVVPRRRTGGLIGL